MSAVIAQMVLRRRAARADAAANQRAYESVVAAAKGDKGDKGDKGEPGRGIAKIEVIEGEVIVTYTDKKRAVAGRLRSEVVIVGGGSSTTVTQTGGSGGGFDPAVDDISVDPVAYYNEAKVLSIPEQPTTGDYVERDLLAEYILART